jgi:hypothetical protein
VIPQASKFLSDKHEPLHIFDMPYPGGKVNTMMDTNMRNVTKELTYSVSKLMTCEKYASYLCKEIHLLHDKLGKLYQHLAGICSQVSHVYTELDKKVKFPNIAKLGDMYRGLKSFMLEHHKMVTKESQCFADNIRAMFDFSIRELEGVTSVCLI